MPLTPRAYDLFGWLLSYPDADYQVFVAECRSLLDAAGSEAAADVGVFADRLQPLGVDELQELFTVTFDLNPVSSPEVGWHLYGETYERGEFMVRARQLLRDCGIAESGELPDHLCHLLPALPRLAPAAARALTGETLLPALEKMIGPLAARENPFEFLLVGIRRVLTREFAVPQPC